MTGTRIVAHRGLHAEQAGHARENTLPSIRDALAAGLTWIEVDVRRTRDGAVVLLHDPTLERLWGDPRAIGQLDLAQVRALGPSEPDRGGIPLLSEALAALDGSGATLLIDMDEPGPAAAAAAVVRASTAEVRTAWCGDVEAMGVIRAELPDASVWLPWYTGEPPREEDLAALRPSVVNVNHLLVGAAFVDAVHELGVECAVWTVNDPAQAAHLAALGADSVTTDAPIAVRSAVTDLARDEDARRLAIVGELAAHAAELTARARHQGIGVVQTKRSAADHVTDVDRTIERDVRTVLRAQFPDHDIVGEEYGGASDGERPCWYLDPVDGTANLANGVPWTSFSLALVEDGRPVIGAILDPAEDGTGRAVPVVASAGRGAWRAGRRLVAAGSAEDPLSGTIVTTELDGALAWPGLHDLIDALGARHCTVRIPGSGTATLSGVALGRGVAAVVHRYSAIDHAAAILVVQESGGAVIDEHGTATSGPVLGPVFTGVDARAALALQQEWRRATAPAVSRSEALSS